MVKVSCFWGDQADVSAKTASLVSRSAFQAPIDPKVVLGGFPTDASFNSYLADTTALLITFPVNATAEATPKALLWEAAFLDAVRNQYICFNRYFDSVVPKIICFHHQKMSFTGLKV